MRFTSKPCIQEAFEHLPFYPKWQNTMSIKHRNTILSKINQWIFLTFWWKMTKLIRNKITCRINICHYFRAIKKILEGDKFTPTPTPSGAGLTRAPLGRQIFPSSGFSRQLKNDARWCKTCSTLSSINFSSYINFSEKVVRKF